MTVSWYWKARYWAARYFRSLRYLRGGFSVAKAQIFVPGAVAAQVFQPGAVKAQTFQPGAVAQQVV